MKLAIAGYGKMGRVIYSLAPGHGFEVVQVIDPGSSDSAVTARDFKPSGVCADVVVDFTAPRAVITNIRRYCEAGIPAVIGTTGWYDDLEVVEELVRKANSALIWSGNFSLGVNIFFCLVTEAGRIFNRFKEYDPAVHEVHHCRKADSPSGTAQMIGDILLDRLERKRNLVDEKLNRPIREDELHVSSTRCGYVPGLHRVTFDSEVDSIILEHSARSREGFARGALTAARWITARRGFFSIDDLMESIIEEDK